MALDNNKDLPEVTLEGLSKLKAYNAGILYAYSRMGMQIVQLDPERSDKGLNVLFKYLDAWLAELNLRNDDLKDYAEELKSTSFKEFLQMFGVLPGDCTVSLAPEVEQKLKDKFKQSLIDVLNEYNLSTDTSDQIDPDDIDMEGL